MLINLRHTARGDSVFCSFGRCFLAHPFNAIRLPAKCMLLRDKIFFSKCLLTL